MNSPAIRATIMRLLMGAALSLLGPCTASAALVFSDNFNGITGTAGSVEPTERRNGTILSSVTIPGWTLEGDATQILGHDSSGDKAVWLNEVGGPAQAISRTIGGLTAGALYTLTFEYWRDNNGADYSFNYEINGVTTGVVGNGGSSNTGAFYTINHSFTASAASTTLRFAETSSTGASPLFDNVAITAAVPEPATYALMLAGLTIVGWGAKRRRILPHAA